MIQAHSLFKRYGAFEAVRDVSFRVDSGSIVGLLGPNGAGKTSVMRILTCYISPRPARRSWKERTFLPSLSVCGES